MFGLAFAMAPQAGGAQGGASPLGSLFFIIMMVAIFYFLIIRPQQKKAKEHRAFIESLKRGDQVVTAGGIHGKVVAIEDNVVTLEIATGVNIKINKAYIASLITKE